MRDPARGRALLGPVLALIGICLLDWLHGTRHWPVPVDGLLDEPAHLLTTWLFVRAAVPRRPGARWSGVLPWALAASVAIDLDHLPVYLWSAPIAAPGSRPVTHSLATVALLVAVAALTRRRARTAALGLAVGVALHLVRDIATGPGVPLLWPFDQSDALVPYGLYVRAIAAATIVAVLGARSPEVSVPAGR